MTKAAVHLIWSDGRTACNQSLAGNRLVSEDRARVTCLHCRKTMEAGARGRADRRNRVTLTPRTPTWNRALTEIGTWWAEAADRRFKVWPVPGRKGGWQIEEVDHDGDTEGYATLDRRYPGERRVVWVGGWYARARTLDEVRAAIGVETATPERGGPVD